MDHGDAALLALLLGDGKVRSFRAGNGRVDPSSRDDGALTWNCEYLWATSRFGNLDVEVRGLVVRGLWGLGGLGFRTSRVK